MPLPCSSRPSSIARGIRHRGDRIIRGRMTAATDRLRALSGRASQTARPIQPETSLPAGPLGPAGRAQRQFAAAAAVSWLQYLGNTEYGSGKLLGVTYTLPAPRADAPWTIDSIRPPEAAPYTIWANRLVG